MPPDPQTASGADRNLLFGVLALQMDFVTRDALIAAMNAWVLEKKKSLGQILSEQGALRAEDRDLLEVLIKRHLKMHGEDVQRSLAALAPVGALRQELQQVADAELHFSLGHLSEGALPQRDPYVTRQSDVGQVSVAGARFRILREHAKGGLGAVFVAQDEELHRQVALKEIQEKYAHHLESQSRFLLEAEVTGGLEHPGIVPVYGLGRYPDGRLFYAMRFIRGDSLREAIRRFYAADEEKRDPGERSLAFRELLRQFVAACNALAYAHARGVLHRDVKPHNIMLGKFGETLVVDWGLAKVMADRERQPKSEEGLLLPSVSGDTAPTQAGHVLGTPSYMSPEQAEGRMDRLGPASDIYGLGATLYELLTGMAPVQGNQLGEILANVKRGDWLPPRKRRKDVPAPLDAICRKAMAMRPEDRYATALELAADIEHWLADEPVAAYREPWTRRLRRWVRRHRGITAGTTGLLVTAVLAASLLAAERHRQRARQALDKEALARSHTTIGLQFSSIGLVQDAEAEHREAISLQKQLTADFPGVPGYRQELAASHNNLGTLLKGMGRSKEAQDAYRDALALQKQLAADFPDVPGYRKDVATTYNNVGRLLAEIGRSQEAERAYRDALALQKQSAADFPDEPAYRQDLARTQNNLGSLLNDTGRLKEAEAVYRDTYAIYEQFVTRFPTIPRYRQELAVSQNNLGSLLQQTGRPKEAERAYREALALQKQLAIEFPALRSRDDLAVSQNNLGNLLLETGRLQDAEGYLRDALALEKQLVAQFPAMPRYRQELATSHSNLGRLFQDALRPKEAEQAYRDAIAHQMQLVDDFANVPAYRQELARSHNNLGALLHVTGRPREEAEAAYRNALTIQKQLVDEFSGVPDYSSELANTMVNLAELLRDHGDFAQARELLEGARPHHETALKANLQNPIYRAYFRNNRALLASTLAGLDDHVRAGQTAEQLAALGWDPAADAYAAARGLAQCAKVTEKDTKLPEPKRQPLVRSYADRALAILRQAIAKGYKDVAHMKSEADFDLLRSQPDFPKLLEEMEEKTKTEGK